MNTIWQERCKVMAEHLEQLAKTYGQTTEPVSGTLQALTESLLAFGRDQFNFFWDGFNNRRLLPSIEIPPEHVLRATIDQASFDAALIQQIFDQRQKEAWQPTLEKADKLAQLALNVPIKCGLLPKCAVLTYFHKSANIRLIPYAPIALIGIPFSAQIVPQDLLAIPHEVGHYVYQHAPGLAAELHALIPLYPGWINHWLEEIFSDVFAAFISGPVSGMSLQEILLDNAQGKFLLDDGIHPPDVVRPYAHLNALRHLKYEQAANALAGLWQHHLTKRHHPVEFWSPDRTSRAETQQAQALLEQTADLFLNYLTKECQMVQDQPWSKDTKAVETLFDTFAQWLKAEVVNNVSVNRLKLLEDGAKVGVVQGIDELQNVRPTGTTQTWRDWIKAESRQQAEVLLPAQAWTPIFTSGHWPVKGPEGNSNGGI